MFNSLKYLSISSSKLFKNECEREIRRAMSKKKQNKAVESNLQVTWLYLINPKVFFSNDCY